MSICSFKNGGGGDISGPLYFVPGGGIDIYQCFLACTLRTLT